MESDLTPNEALKKAVLIVGSQAAMARLLGIKQPSVWAWLKGGKSVPAEHVLKVESATGVSRHDLRPDVYPRDLAPPPGAITGQLEGFRA
jgi:DNA-binding transcriptional regulator YdaS (Cro superfamily)